MFVHTIVYFILCIIAHQFAEGDENVAHYLTNQSDVVSSLLRGTRKIFGHGITVEFYDAQPLLLQKTYKHALAFSIFNVTHLLVDANVYILDDNYEVRDFQSIYDKRNSQVTVVKAVNHKNFGLVAFAFADGLLTIYGKSRKEIALTFFHSIAVESCNDIHFFEEDGDLFMAVAAAVPSTAGPSACRGICIFKWTGAHFDKVYEVSTVNAVRISSFHSEEGRIVVVLQKEPRSIVFVFKDYELHKIQNLKTINPSEVISYKIEGNHYIVILDGSFYTTYLWNGAEFLLIKSSKCLKLDKIYINHNVDHPTLFATRSKQLIIYKPTLTGSTSHNITIDFHGNHSNISTIVPIFQNADFALLTFGLTPHATATVYPFSIYFNQTAEDQQSEEAGDDLLGCLKTLGKILDGEKKTLSNKKNVEKYTKAKFEKATGAANSKGAFVGAALFGAVRERLESLQDDFLKLRESTHGMQQRITEFINKPILGDASIKGSLIAQTLETVSLWDIQKLNNKTWNPNSWLTYHSPQVVTGPVFANAIVVKNLRTSPNDPTFKDLLHSNTQTLTGNNEFQHLKASEIICNVINDIPFNAIYLKSQHKVIKGKKIFDSLRARNVTVTTLNKKPPYETLNALSDSKMYDFKFGSHLIVQNLTVKEINGINWDTFSKSVFRIGKSSTITGNLKISGLSVNHLKARSIDGVKVSDFFTKTTDQVVNSTFHFQNIDVSKNFNCSEINNMDMQNESIVIIPRSVVVIKSPVSIKTLKPYEKLYINTSKPGFTLNNTESNYKPNILQVYHGKVKIIGNVELTTVSLDSFAEVIVNGRPFQISMLQNYWLKNYFQVIPVHVTFQKGANVPHIFADSINNVDVRDYLVQNARSEKFANFYFENITVFGDVFLNPGSQHWPDFKKIESESVKYSGRQIIKGRKTFDGTVRIEHLKTTSLDNVDCSKVINKNSEGRITGRKHFESIEVLKNLEANSSIIDKINDVNLQLLQDEALYIDEGASLPLVNFNDLRVKNLKVNHLNGKSIRIFVTETNKKLLNETIVSISLEGNVTISNATLRYINGIAVNDMMMRILNNTFIVPHDVYFPKNVRVKHLQAAKINGVNINHLSKRLLYRNYEQVVTAPFTFNNITTDNLFAEKINNISLGHLIEADRQSNIVNPKNVTLNSVKYITRLTTHLMSCDIEEAINELENPSNVKWKTIEVVGDLKIVDESSDFINVLQNIVTTTSNNVITAPITFDKPLFANIVTTAGSISGVNITKIVDDAIFSTVKGKPITITGRNTFQAMKSAEVTVLGNAEISKVNNISVRKVNSSIIYKDSKSNYTIKGKKTFLGGLETNHLYTKTIAGLKPENLVNLENLQMIPEATFDRLVVTGNMTIEKVNDVDFEWFLKNRVLCKSNASQILQGTYHFEEMLLNNSVLTSHLNHLPIEDIVTDGDLQNVESDKVFLHDTSFKGNINVDLLNGVNLTRFYENSVFAVRNEAINGSLMIKSNSSVSSNLNVQILNGVPIERLKYILNFHDPEIVATSTGNTLQRISDVVERSLVCLEFLPDKFMYIQEVTTFQASLPPSQDVRIIQQTQNSTLVLIDGQISGTFCGLPQDCPCPTEQSVYFGPGKLTINNNTGHRVFKYNEDDLFVSLSTKAISVNSYCRTNMSKVFNEYSQFSWKNNKTGLKGSRKITGYLSDAEFFSHNDRIYVVFCEYYDPVFDTHELFCTVFKSNEQKDLEEIQNIPVKGAWKTHILYTAQGVVLVIGNVVPGISNYTDIYRFNPVQQKFDLLRRVKTIGCTATAGVVLQTDSLIILAQPETPVHILKYDRVFDNYYYYQRFSMDYPVVSVSVFYTGGFGISDAYLSVVMLNGAFSIYSFNEIEGWKLKSSGRFEGLTDLIPIEMDRISYLFAPSSVHTRLLSVVKQSYV